MYLVSQCQKFVSLQLFIITNIGQIVFYKIVLDNDVEQIKFYLSEEKKI